MNSSSAAPHAPQSQPSTLSSIARGFQRWVNGAALLVCAAILALGLLYWFWYESHRSQGVQRYQRAVLVFTQQTRGVIDSTIASFARTRSMSLPEVSSIPDTPAFAVRNVAVKAERTASAPTSECPLELRGQGEDKRLEFELAGFTRNAEGGWEDASATAVGHLEPQLRLYARNQPFDALLVVDDKGELILHEGFPEARPARRTLKEFIEKQEKELSIADRDYRVFHREVPLYHSATAQSLRPVHCKDSQAAESLHVLGLVSQDRIRSESLRLPSTPLIVLSLLVFLGVLSFPFLKLFFAEEAERFRRVDAILLLACSVLLFAMVVFGVLFTGSAWSLEEWEDRQMKEIATELPERFREERALLARQLEHLEQNFPPQDPQPSETPRPQETAPSANTVAKAAMRASASTIGAPAPASRYPDFEEAFGLSGETLVRWSRDKQGKIATEAAPAVEDDALFQDADSCFQADAALEVAQQQLWSAGERMTVLARRMPCREDKPEASFGTIRARLRSLEQAILPRGYGFAVLDSQRKLLYHSDSWRAGFENFLAETEQDPSLLACLATGCSSSFDISYRGRPHQISVQRFDRDLRLAVFRSLEPSRSIRFYTALFTLSIFSFYLIGLAVVLAVLLSILPSLRVAFHCPRLKRGEVYAYLFLSYALLLGVSWAVARSLPPWAAVMAGLLVPAAALSLTAATLARLLHPNDRRASRSRAPLGAALAAVLAVLVSWGAFVLARAHPYPALALAAALVPLFPSVSRRLIEVVEKLAPERPWLDWLHGQAAKRGALGYASALALLLLLLGGFPAYAFYNAAFRQEARLLAERSLSGRLEDLQSRWRSRQAAQGGESADLRTARTLDIDLSLQGGKEGEEGPEVSEPRNWPRFDSLYGGFRRLNNEYTVSTTGFLWPHEGPGWDGQPPTCRRSLDAVRCSLGLSGENDVVLATNLAAVLPVDGDSRAVLGLAFVLLGLAAASLTRAAVDRLFLTDVERRFEVARLRDKRVLWVALPGSWVGRLASKHRAIDLSLRHLAEMTDAEIQSLGQGIDEVRPLLVRDFSLGWIDSESVDLRLKLLQRLQAQWQGGLWLVSDVAPDQLPATDPKVSGLRSVLENELQIVHPDVDVDELRSAIRRSPAALWRTLTLAERRVCLWVATAGFFRLGPPASSLIRYGILTVEPFPTFVDPAFRSYVLGKDRDPEMTLPQDETSGRWQAIQTAMVVLLLGGLLFLLITQESSFKWLSGAITSLAAVLAGLSQLGTYLRPTQES